MAYNPDDQLQPIEYLTSNSTFLDWVNHYNTNVVNKLNNLQIYKGIGGTGISFTVGTTAGVAAGGATAGISAGMFRVSLDNPIAEDITFGGNVTIDGTLTATLSGTDIQSVVEKVYPRGGWTATKGYTFGNPIRIGYSGGGVGHGTSGDYYAAKANNKTEAEVWGVVSGINYPATYAESTTENTYLEVTLSGKVSGDFGGVLPSGVTGLTAGSIYFLSPTVTGGITPVEPTVDGQVSKPVLLGATYGVGYVVPYRGQYLQGSGTGGTGGIDNNRFIVSMSSGHGIVRGDVVGYKSDIGSNGWFVADQSNTDNLQNVVGVCLRAFVLDSTDYIEVATTGFVRDLPSSDTGVLFIGKDGKLTNVYAGIFQDTKIMGVAWAGGGTDNPVDGMLFASPDVLGRQLDPETSNSSGSGSNKSYRSTAQGGTTFGSVINDNLMINGAFDIWQRNVGIGAGGSYGATGSLYFADRWVRHDGVSGGGGTPGTYNILRKDFDTNQTEVFGEPKHYLRTEHIISSPSGGDSGDFVRLINRVEDARTLRGENASLSFYARCGITGATMGIHLEQYDGTNLHGITSPAAVSVGTLWSKYEVAFKVPEMNSAVSDDHYLGVGFDVASLQCHLDLAKVKLERGLIATSSVPTIDQEELRKCMRYYQRSYDVDQQTGKHTMLAEFVPDASVVEFIVTPLKDHVYKFPVEMRKAPTTVTVYSPKTGATADAFNRSAKKDLKKVSGTSSFDGSRRIAAAGATTISVPYTSNDGLYFLVNAGGNLWDVISLQYIADADINSNMPY